MGSANPYLADWARCQPNSRSGSPILDVGCAYGRNAAAAHRELMRRSGPPPDGRPWIVAADCDEAHLAEVDALGLSGVVTAHCRLPAGPPAGIGRGALSGILLSEVVHFLREGELEASLRWMHDALEDGGRLFITAGSYLCNLLGPDCPIGKHARERRRALGPGGVDVRAIVLSDAAAQAAWRRELHTAPADSAPTYLRWYGEELAQACRDAGLFVVECKFEFREGYKEAFRNDGRECVHVHCVRVGGG